MAHAERSPRWEALGNGVGVYTTSAFSLTTDTLLLAGFSAPRPGERCCELGTGCGAIPLLWAARRGKAQQVLAVELQPEAAALAARSVEENGFSGEIEVVEGDARDFKSLLPHQGFHLMVCNPPYYREGGGAAAAGARGSARQGRTLKPEDVCAAARYALRYGGRLCLCFPTERMAELLGLLRGAALEPKRLRLVQGTPEKPPYLFLLECRRGGKTGLTVEKNLIVTDEEGRPTAALLELTGGALPSGKEGGSL